MTAMPMLTMSVKEVMTSVAIMPSEMIIFWTMIAREARPSPTANA
jgi:hypothetical protein